jgi:membrane protein DedA with SNARE-associated domain
MTTVLAAPLLLPSALNAIPTGGVVAVLCVAVIGEIIVTPTLLPGATITLLAGALVGAGRPGLAVVLPLVVAVVGGDQAAYFAGSAVRGWWNRRRPGRPVRPPRGGAVGSWVAAAFPSFAGAAGLSYRQFVIRVLVLRVPWLAAALGAGLLASRSITRIGHVIGIVGILATVLAAACLLAVRRRASESRNGTRRAASRPHTLSSTTM